MISVIIPAYNEERVIGRTISSVLSAMKQEPGELIVVCNGCRDSTFEKVQSFPTVKVINLEMGSKTIAMNAGDKLAQYFPRYFLDADVELSENALAAVSSRLRQGDVHAATPTMRCRMDEASWAVRAFYDVWLRQPYHTDGHVGSGFIGMSQAGRKRFSSFPETYADDEFVRCHFNSNERSVVEGAWFEIRVPKDLETLIKIKARSRLGTIHLFQNFPQLESNRKSKSVMRNWSLFPLTPKQLVYTYVVLRTRWHANRQWKSRVLGTWERDETTRQ